MLEQHLLKISTNVKNPRSKKNKTKQTNKHLNVKQIKIFELKL